MPEKIPLAFFLSTRHRPVVPGSDTWRQPLPLCREPGRVNSTRPDEKTVSYGDYFTAVGIFLEKDGYRAVKAALGDSGQGAPDLRPVEALSVFLVKHGEFYHPARVVVKSGPESLSFVVNVAVSKPGRDHINAEFDLLARLCPEYERPTLPRVYLKAEVSPCSGKTLILFNGQWFDGFCEFHLTTDSPENMSRLIVWGQDDTRFFLTREQAVDVYRQAARILTTAYDFFTFEHISAWHHAAGDFILKPVDAARVDLRLITVRKYIPLVENSRPDPAALVEALLLFFVRLTIRNRLDRLDGTGALAWVEDAALVGTVEGFFKGLEAVVRKADLPESFPAEFKNFIRAHSKAALNDLFFTVANTIPRASQEHALVKTHIGNHAAQFHRLIRTLDRGESNTSDTR